jgi:outer membrane autotransporter protein
MALEPNVLNTFLGADNSPSDKLVTGSASGTTSLNISNVGGPGVETTSNGILVVQTTSTTANAFTLDNPELRAGAFDYRLFRGGLNGTDPNDWFLRSTFNGPGPPDPIGPNPPPQPLPPGFWPIIAGACHRWRGATDCAADRPANARHTAPTHW